MKTKLITSDIETAAEILRAGGLVAVPTETVYGLAGNGLDSEVIEKIYEVKGRPSVKPISLMVSGSNAINDLCEKVPVVVQTLTDRFWPGPLTLVLRAKTLVPEILRAGGETVGLRCPRQPQTLALLERLDYPLAVPSANPSGEPSPHNAQQVMDYFGGKIEAVIDGGESELGLESTVVDFSRTPYRILRQGSLPAEELMDALVDAMTVVGITGGSGCGKTTALYELEKRGALILDCDAIYHELLEKDLSLIEELGTAFPGTVKEGKLRRGVLAEIVFRDAVKLKQLNEITHRRIEAEITSHLRDWAMQGGTLAALDAIELISSGLAERCDFTMAVIASEDTRIQRIMERDRISRESAKLRIKAQRPNEYFEQNCDVTLCNNGSFEQFVHQLNDIWEERLNHG